ENAAEDRRITDSLYGGDEAYRLKQEMVLGFGGVRILHALGFDISEYHMNEGHSALLGIELLRRYAYPADDIRKGELPYDVPRVRELCRFTTHTPVEAGHDRFSYDLVRRLFFNGDPGSRPTDPVDLGVLREIGGAQELNMTQLALGLSGFVNGVARSHAEVSAKLFPGYRVRAITNGVHPYAWTAAGFRELYDRYVPGWCYEPELLVRADAIPDAGFLEAHARAKRELLGTVRKLTGRELRPEVATLGFARRMTAYKRPDLLTSDPDRLRAIARSRPLQIIMAGKAHPRDDEGKRLISLLHERARELADAVSLVYLPNYDMSLAQQLVAGCDVWVNTPLPPMEASGTSGMKAAFNGVPSLSVADGWWIEGCIEGVTGWTVEDSASLYGKLEQFVLPLFYEPGAGRWVNLMRNAITKNAAYFNSHRMMRRYATEAYLR
ncbi:MAG TPA: alpha-glucan family phosphorylase, partial [Steroidobacteraceae bacterium]|nr:alpha-glucan family phosphorylase [Steroidobacteraceae bacterium]